MNELRLLRRVALALTALGILAAVVALHGLRSHRIAEEAKMGMTLAGPAPVITSLRRGGRADRAGLMVGDVVETVNGHMPGSLPELEHAMAADAPASIRVRRGMHDVAVVLW